MCNRSTGLMPRVLNGRALWRNIFEIWRAKCFAVVFSGKYIFKLNKDQVWNEGVGLIRKGIVGWWYLGVALLAVAVSAATTVPAHCLRSELMLFAEFHSGRARHLASTCVYVFIVNLIETRLLLLAMFTSPLWVKTLLASIITWSRIETYTYLSPATDDRLKLTRTVCCCSISREQT